MNGTEPEHGPGGPGGHGFGHGPGGDEFTAAASYLGLTESALATQLQAGKTLAQVADATSGKSAAGLVAALVAAEKTEIAAAVTAGRLTQAQADAIKQKLANQTPCTLPSAAGRTGDKGAIGAYLQQYMSAAASALGITQAQLTTDLKNGQSLSQIAAAQKVSEADFRTRLIANLKPALDKAVADKKLTAAQEQAIVNRLQTGPLPLWQKAARRPKPSTTASPSPA